jgi:hypothetical protein
MLRFHTGNQQFQHIALSHFLSTQTVLTKVASPELKVACIPELKVASTAKYSSLEWSKVEERHL